MDIASSMESTSLAQRAQRFFEGLQGELCASLEMLDGAGRFGRDPWSRPGGGGGVTRVLEGGKVFEKGAVNVSAVHGLLPEAVAGTMGVRPSQFSASGISLVIHPSSPMIPAVHANFRYFEKDDGDAWFGGGIDLTPNYLFEEDAVHFHTVLKQTCDRHDRDCYPRFKKWCDEYFIIKHRQERRGIGGIFFDYLRQDTEKCFAFVQSLGYAFLEAYAPIVKKRLAEPFGEEERRWQLCRRGRYVEFNLVYDRGTHFGLETGGRAESVLMSLPPIVSWPYNLQPKPGSREERLIEVLMQPREWCR